MIQTLTAADRDTESRNRIVSDIGVNFFVEAGAGSGKTTMLVRRMVAMVEAGIPIEKISAITFTKAAAGEFYDRFQKLLIERSNPDITPVSAGTAGELPPPTDETRALCARALQNIDLCFMGTIDSFCYRILSEHPSEAGISSDASIISDADAEEIYTQQYARICDGKYGEELAEQSRIFRGLFWKPREAFLKGISVFMNNRNVTFHFTPLNSRALDPGCEAYRQALVRALGCLVEHPELQYPAEKYNLAAWEKIDDHYRRLRSDWSSNLADVRYSLNQVRYLRILPGALPQYSARLGGFFAPGGKKGKWLQFQENGDVQEMLKEFQYSAAMTFLSRCVPVLEQAMRERGSMTFFDCLYILRNMLKTDAEQTAAQAQADGSFDTLIRSIYERHSYFLIDEFQDTNPLQAEIFFYLTAENPRPRWSDCIPRPGSLFIVGDPKQSIYRFRSADVTSFLRVRSLFQSSGGDILTLSRNFRSTSTLCRYFNRVFSEELAQETENQSRFEEIPIPADRPDEFQGTWVYHPETAKKKKDAPQDPDQEDPGMILRIIRTLVNREKYQIRSEANSELRKIHYGDFMVITKRKADLGPIMARLHEEGIPVRVEGEVPFAQNEALREVYRIYAAVADMGDTIALVDALTGKRFGLTLEDLLQYCACGGRLSLYPPKELPECKDERFLRVSEKLDELRTLAVAARGMSPAALFSRILDGFCIYEVAEPDNLEVLFYSLELLRNAEQSGEAVSLKEGSALLKKQVDDLSDEERCLRLTDGKDCVHLANLHKVKGLEAPIVILAAASEKSFPPDIRIVHGDDGSEGYLFAMKDQNSYMPLFETSQFAEEREKEAEAMEAEKQRLVYVAATRARNALLIADGGDKGNKWSPLLKQDFVGEMQPVTLDHTTESAGMEAAESVTDLYREADETWIFQNRSGEEATYQIENPSRLRLVSRIRKDLEEDTVTDLILAEDLSGMDAAASESVGQPVTSASEKRFPALLGTMTHKLMEVMVSSRNQTDARPMVDEILREYRTTETEQYERELGRTLRGVAETMRNGGYPQTNGAPQDILTVLLTADEVYCEVPFSCRQEVDGKQVVWSGIMDVVYCSGGRWHILDYKTNADGDDLDVKYQAQLQAYIRALREIMGYEADAMTYHISV